MADISKTLASLLTAASNKDLKNLDKELSNVNNEMRELASIGDIKSLARLKEYAQEAVKLRKILEDLNKVQQEINDTKDEEKKLKLIEKATKLYGQVEDSLQSLSKARQTDLKLVEDQAKQEEELRKQYEDQKKALDDLQKKYSLVGQAKSLLTSQTAKFAKTLTGAALAMRAFNRINESTKLRMDLQIQSFQGVNREVSELGTKNVSNLLKFDKALANSRGVAKSLGMDVEDAGRAFKRFARMTGDTSPENLQRLTNAALTTARSLNIDMMEAVEFVQNRLDKFGGSASDASLSLHDMRDSTHLFNQSLGQTVLRGDDLVRTINDISNASDVYAIDQRAVGNILRDNVSQLQATGRSYDFAKKNAVTYLEALGTKAPEFQKILAGQDLVGKFMAGFDGGKLEKGMAEELDKAKPGLSKEVADILKSDASLYEKQRLVQELVKDTSVGMEVMNDRILKFSKGQGGLLRLQAAYGLESIDQARALVTQAQHQKDIQSELGNLQKMSFEDFKKTVQEKYKEKNLSDEALKILKENKGELKDMIALNITRQEMDKKGLKLKQDMTAEEKASKQANLEALQEKYKQITAEEELAKKTGDRNKQLLIGKQKTEIEQQLKVVGEELGVDGLANALDTANKQAEDRYKTELDGIKGTIEKLTNIENLAIAAAAAGVARFAFQQHMLSKQAKHLANIEKALLSGGGPGGGNDDGGFFGDGGLGSAKRAGKSKGKLATLAQKSRIFGKKLLGSRGRKLLSGAGSMLSSGLGQKLLTGAKFGGKKLLGSVGSLASLAMDAPQAISAYKKGGIGGMLANQAGNIGSLIGGALGGVGGTFLMPGAGTVAGGMAGSMAGEALGQKIASWFGAEDPLKAQKALSEPTAVTMPDAGAKTTSAGSAGVGELFGNMGMVNPDGSINIKIPNFMNAFSSASSLAKQKKIGG